MEYELCHHGVKGMRWGVRRYQNKDGSLTEAGKKKFEDWRSKESDRITKKWQVDKLNAQRDRLEDKYLNKGGLFIESRLTKARYYALKASGMEYLEKTALNSMSYQDMLKEQSDIRQAKVKKFFSGIGKKAVGAVIGESSPSLFLNTDLYKTNRRVSLEDSVYNDYEARKYTYYRGL